MLRNNSLSCHDSSSYRGSFESNGYSTMDETSSQISNVSRPSAKSIYLQRRDYAVSINKMMDKLQYKVEHLFTCELDGKELRSTTHCVERLKLLDGMGRVWGQNMQLEVRGANLLLTDIETKEDLESMASSDIVELKAVLDAGVFNSLLTVSVKPAGKDTTTVFMFQCDEVRADYVQRDLSGALSRRRQNSSISNAGLIAGLQGMKNLHNAAKSSEPKEQKPAVDSGSQWMAPDYEKDDIPEPELIVHQEEEEEEEQEEEEEEEEEEEKKEKKKEKEKEEEKKKEKKKEKEKEKEKKKEKEKEKKKEKEKEAPPLRAEAPSPQPSTTKEEPLPPPRSYTDLDRNVDILNHIISDIEIFMGKVAAVVAKNAKKKKKKKKGKAMDGMPPAAEFEVCLRKIKCGFNLVGELNGLINNPSAPEFIHSLFSTLAYVASHCPEDLPKTIVAPLLTPECIRLLSEEASTEEDQLWQSLGDAWNIPSTRWPEDDEDIPTYTLEFFDGWQPPEVTAVPEPSEPMRRQEAQQPAPDQISAKRTPPPHRPQKTRSSISKSHCMHVMCDFISRNHRELTVRKGEVVELLDMSKQWWKVRNSDGEEGFVPNNVLEAHKEQPVELTGDSAVLTKKSKSAGVKAWLEDKGFSKITVRCLGGLSGSMLLGMTREELKTVCPEEGGRVFFQLQAVKSAMAVAI